MNKRIHPYPPSKNRSSASVLTLMGCLVGAGLCCLALLYGCAAKTAASVNSNITSAIAGAGAAANQAETDYQNKVITQTPAARNTINALGLAYNEARNAFIVVLNAEAVYRGAEQLQLIACAPKAVAPANPPQIDCGQMTQNVANAAAKVQAAETDLSTSVANLANQTKAVQALKK
jgi:hypothetical protein